MGNENGNALFLILIAVALFAALSYAVTQSSRGGGSGVDSEKLSLEAAQVLQTAVMYKTTIDRLKISHGCSDEDLSFENSITGDYTNAGAPADNSCHIFDPAGGGMFYNAPPDKWLDSSLSAIQNHGEWLFASERIYGVGTDGCGNTTCVEMLMFLTHITKDLCLEINRQLGVPEYSGDPPQEGDDIHYSNAYLFLGSGSWFTGLLRGTGVGKPFDGLTAACIEGGPNGGVDQTGRYFFYQVLVAR